MASIFDSLQVTTKKVGDKASLEVPQYGDILGEELDVLNEVQREAQAWQMQFLRFASNLAKKQNKSLQQIAEMLGEIQNQDVTRQLEILGDDLPLLTEIMERQPNETEQLYRLASTVIHRVDANFDEKQIKKLPVRLLRQLVDFLYEEQREGTYVPYDQLANENEYLKKRLELASKVVDTAKSLVKSKVPNTDALKAKLVEYGVASEELGKQGSAAG